MSVGGLATGNVPSGPAAFGNGRRTLRLAALACMIAFPAALWVAGGNELCLAADSIGMRDNALNQARRYAWSDIIGLQTMCSTQGLRHRRLHEGAHYVLSDGQGFWLSGDEYAKLHIVLSVLLIDVPYKFAVSDIDETCPENRMALFGQRP